MIVMTSCTHCGIPQCMYTLNVANIGLKMVLWKPKHVAKKLMYWCCVETGQTIVLNVRVPRENCQGTKK